MTRTESSNKLVFRQWSNKKWAVLASLNKVIVIATLSFSYNLLAQESSGNETDSTQYQISLELDEVEVSEEWPAQLEEISLKPILIVSSGEIEAAAATAPEDILEYMPQVDIRQRGKHETQADLSIQAGSFDQSMVLLNGINISDPQTGHFHLNLPLDLNSVQSMELVTGASARRFGSNAFSGAVNLVTRPADSTFLNAGFRYGQHRYYKGHLKGNLAGKHLLSMISLNTAGSDGYRENTDFRTTHVYLHTQSKPGKLVAHLMTGINLRAFGANAFYSPRFIKQYEETSTGLAALKLVKRTSRSVWTAATNFRIARDHFLLDRYDPSFYNNDHLTMVAGLDLSVKFYSSAGLTQSGINFRREEILSTSLGESLEEEDQVKFRDTITFTNGHVRKQFNWNVNHSFESGPFSFSGGMLVHLNADMGYKPQVYPGLDLKVRLPGYFSLYASANRSMRLPTFTDLYYQGPSNVGNPELTPERASTLELGFFRSHKGFYAGVNGFYRLGRDMIDWVWMDDEKWHTLNLTRIDAMGGDIQLKYNNPHIANKYLQLESAALSYTHTHLNRVSQEVNSRYLLDNLRHKIVAGVSIKVYNKLRFSLKTSYQKRNGSYLAYDPVTGQSKEKAYDGFILLDVKLAYSLWRFSIFLESTNLLDASYMDIGNVVQPGRWTMVGFEFR